MVLVASGVHNMGGVHTLACNELTQQLILWCKNRHIWISACHIAGKDNTETDDLGRKFNENIEWALDQDSFNDIYQKLSTPEIDLFASWINKKLARYMSFLPDAEAEAINTFHHIWQEFSYIFPPFNLIPSRPGGLAVERRSTTELPRVRSPVTAGMLAYLLTQQIL